MQKFISPISFLLAFFLTVLPLSTRATEAPATQQIRPDKLLLLDATYAGKNIVAVGERGTILVSSDAGNTWQQARTPTQATLTALTFTDEQLGWAVGHDAVILGSRDGGKNWQQLYSAPEQQAPLLDVWFENSLSGYAVGAYGSFYQTRDGGKTWQARKILADDMHINTIVGGADGKLFIAGEAGMMYRSSDHGANWQALPSPYRGSFFGALRLGSNTLLAFGLRGHIFRSPDFGQHWSAVPADSQASLMGGHILSDGAVVIVGHDGVILRSQDQGKTFTLSKTKVSKALAAVLGIQPEKLLLFGEAGVSSKSKMEQ